MSADAGFKHEELITLAAAMRHLPAANGRHPDPSTGWRWCRKGIKGISLEYIRVGRRIFTSVEALRRFTTALAEADVEPDQRIYALQGLCREERPQKARNEAVRRARLELAAAGIA